jgi:hypothetical protein
VDVVRKGRRGEWCALEATVAEQAALEAERGETRQRQESGRAIVRIGRPQFEVKQ